MEALESGEKPCDLMKVIKHDPLVPFTLPKMITVGSMVIMTAYGLTNFLKFFVQLRSTLNVISSTMTNNFSAYVFHA